MTMYEFLTQYGITATARQVDPSEAEEKHWGIGASHWKVTLKNANGRRMTSPFHQGSAHTQPPTAADVLRCTADDAASVANAVSFEEWADELGLNPDSRADEKSYQQCVKQAAKLCEFLGDEAHETLLWKVERD